MFVHVSVCASVQLETHGPKNTNKIIDVRALRCTTFHSMLLYMMENMHVLIWESQDQLADSIME